MTRSSSSLPIVWSRQPTGTQTFAGTASMRKYLDVSSRRGRRRRRRRGCCRGRSNRRPLARLGARLNQSINEIKSFDSPGRRGARQHFLQVNHKNMRSRPTGLRTLTCCHAEKVVGARPVHLNVTGAHEVLVAAQRQVPLFAALELDQSLAVASALPAQTQPNAASVVGV